MHITKNVCEILLGTMLNMPKRTKDGSKERHDLMPESYFTGGQKGPMPVISLGANNLDNRPPNTHAQCTPNLVTPPAGNVGAREDSSAVGGTRSPSVTCMPGLSPSTRDELDALTEDVTPCTLLLNVDNELKAVARASVLLPTMRMFKYVMMDDSLTPDMRSVHEAILMKEGLLLQDRNPSYLVLTAKVPTGFGFVTTYPADLILEYCALILFHPYHSHVAYLDSETDKRKDYTDIRSTLDKTLNSFIAEVGIDKLRQEKKVKGFYVCNHITNFPCLKQSADNNGMESWFAILQMRAIVRSENDLLLPAGLQKRYVNMSDTTDANVTYYVVYHGRVPGVYEDWEDYRRQVHHFSGNSYKGYTTLEEAETRYANFRARQRREIWRTPLVVMMLANTASLVYYMQPSSPMMPNMQQQNMPLIQAPPSQSPVTPLTVNNTNIIRNLIPGEFSYTCVHALLGCRMP
ncbi:hypothetical protein QYE76_030152 [Lolium multiflorum]|uniref:Ribonuclease H1 N-terminal domain-containing protein n=1 Tax=Lolium multiflorum TaxID=4521 RepID=A0AAD8QSK4_LOLMU|nr:hypothetical protein QYE76_030152 [Lolium multiflorum]